MTKGTSLVLKTNALNTMVNGLAGEGRTTETVKGQPPRIILESTDKQLIGQVAAKIRSLRKPEPYKGKGIKYTEEILRKKAGKSAGKK